MTFSADNTDTARSNRPFILGAAAGVVATVVMRIGLFFSCPLLATGCGASNIVPLAFLAGAILCIVAILSFAFPGGLRFAAAFGLMALVASVDSRGRLLHAWSAPFVAIAREVKPVWTPPPAPIPLRDEKSAWVGLMSAQTLEVLQGVRMARELQACVERYRAADSLGSYPRDADALSLGADCRWLANDRLDATGPVTRYDARDHGYRWLYTAGAPNGSGPVQRYVVRVEPDSLLRKAGPVYRTDETGLLFESSTGDAAPVVVASPAAFLKDISPCIAQLPAERLRRKARTDYYYSEPTAFQAAVSVCPDIGWRVRTEGDNSATVAIPIHESHSQFVDTASVYMITYVPLDSTGRTFELHAVPTSRGRIPGGLRRYLVAADGSLHVTWEPRTVALDDPAPVACEVTPATPCRP